MTTYRRSSGIRTSLARRASSASSGTTSGARRCRTPGATRATGPSRPSPSGQCSVLSLPQLSRLVEFEGRLAGFQQLSSNLIACELGELDPRCPVKGTSQLTPATTPPSVLHPRRQKRRERGSRVARISPGRVSVPMRNIKFLSLTRGWDSNVDLHIGRASDRHIIK
jgi:hypothetical protein